MSGCQGPDGSGRSSRHGIFAEPPSIAQINLIVWCVLIFSVVRGCDPTKEPPTPDIMPRFAVVLGQVVSASLTSFTAGRTHKPSSELRAHAFQAAVSKAREAGVHYVDKHNAPEGIRSPPNLRSSIRPRRNCGSVESPIGSTRQSPPWGRTCLCSAQGG